MNALTILIDQRRALAAALAAALAGKDVEISIALGDRDAADLAMKEMRAQVMARRAAREAGCFFDESGERDEKAMKGRTN